ncbi:hypothetical protein [Paenibacillus senegalimassiliensis]|uniref:hypothetical protein n=1 Tax=Paenibacillus senegalimassiliensis TaxID=1737426 RepID=UPI00073E540E|nr:hypothetical protein [Paenibacillus senegalimassiliensis]
MPVTITINGESATQAIEEFATLSAAFTGENSIPPLTTPNLTGGQSVAPAVSVTPIAPPTTPVALSSPAPIAPPAQVPTAASPAYDLNQLGVAAQPLVDAGRGPELIGWLHQHSAQALTDLNPSLYGEFATYLRSLGARI